MVLLLRYDALNVNKTLVHHISYIRVHIHCSHKYSSVVCITNGIAVGAAVVMILSASHTKSHSTHKRAGSLALLLEAFYQ
jgi:hypothetical protein